MKCALLLVVLMSLSTTARASEMRTFLLSCAYGTGIGALAGLTALAFSEQPGSHLSYLTRGASIGLYTGMGIGYYLISKPESDFRGDTQPTALHQRNEIETITNPEPNLPSMPLIALLPSGTREKPSADLFVGYRFTMR